MHADQQQFLKFDSAQARFDVWLAENPHVYHSILKMARALKRAGHSHFGMRALFEVLRYRTSIRQNATGEAFKINNNYAPLMTRYIERCHPEFIGFFETRALRSSK